MRRLYVGGLSHTVTQKDLKDRFGKFGDVEDVELRTRKDEDGVPYKTFGYININISDADLKKCLTVLNKSKWKGGTLQIEPAKESFLHRLSQERQAAADQRLYQPAADDQKQKLLESLSKVGVENFTMKAAVPGTEIPGHKDWVVSKFGRVLPVLQLRSQKGSRARTLKYDPSKYCHNIRRLDRQEVDGSTPVTQLTWQVQGGHDDISKRRRGEFPPYELPQRKKIRTDEVNSHDAAGKTRSEHPVNSVHQTEARHVTNGFQPRPAQRTWRRDSDVDSDEEIRRLVANQQTSHDALQQDDSLEVVGLDYLEKCGHKGEKDEDDYDSADTDEIFASGKPPQTPGKPPPTQEKLSQPTTGNSTYRKRKKTSKAEEEEDSSNDDEEHLASKLQRGNSSKQKPGKKLSVVPVVKPRLPVSDSDDEENDEDEESESAASCSDSDYEAMFSNVTHLEISLADLQKLAKDAEQNSETTAPRILSTEREPDTKPTKKGTTPEEILAALLQDDSSDDERDKKKKKKRKGGTTTLPAFTGTKELNEESERDQKKRDQKEVKEEQLNSRAAQMNLRGADDETNEEEEEKDISDAKVLEMSSTKTSEKDESGSSSHSDDDNEEGEEEGNEEEQKTDKLNEEEVVNNITAPKFLKISSSKTPEKAENGSSSSSGDGDDEEEENEDEEENEEEVVKNQTASEVLKTSPVNPEKAETDSSSSSDDDENDDEEEDHPPVQVVLAAEEEEERQRKANLRRLAAVQQRQKEAEEHKKLIQGALSNLDAPAAATGKHIVFGSDDDDEEKPPSNSELTASWKSLILDGQSEAKDAGDEAAAANREEARRSGPRLFDGSEDEEEEEDHRFDIRPQFEGRAGQKLMELQCHFGIDERFKMDSRFLEEDGDEDEESETKKSPVEEDEALEEERKRNLSILNSVLGSSEQTCNSKTAGKTKKFRDVSALHYDPSREEHAAFETKTDDTKKESKAARRKKKEEAQKLPEVSKEIYYDVSGDLKAVFGQTKDGDTEGEETTNWDQVEEEEQKEEETTISADPKTEKEDSSGFKFSFFGDDTETTTTETEYKVEMIQAPKVSWQQDLSFNDSSSEEDEDEQEEEEEDEEQSSPITKTTEDETPSKMDLFFFHLNDSRLTEGPRLFCRTSQLEDQREQWEERRTELRQEYRKKHKDARRKLASSLKS
ncbi:nucleolar protein 8 isoform X2 [Amphiprion ocellaris]|uniref:nucleolar protein 8 isoform X2 n=1 Tax=Amphiprion ocellaris TaxID=80972 RepID=UPI002410E2C1|nr:nucleolar protein 8 isoform X2 [Amphiprion ocellaris]